MAQAGEFGQIWWGGFDGVAVEWSNYISDLPAIPLQYQPSDFTSFQVGGSRTVSNMIRGSRQVIVTVNLYFDPLVCNFLNQILGARLGTNFEYWPGKNYLPSVGEKIFKGTFTLFKISHQYNAGADAIVACTLQPSDPTNNSSALVPDWYFR